MVGPFLLEPDCFFWDARTTHKGSRNTWPRATPHDTKPSPCWKWVPLKNITRTFWETKMWIWCRCCFNCGHIPLVFPACWGKHVYPHNYAVNMGTQLFFFGGGGRGVGAQSSVVHHWSKAWMVWHSSSLFQQNTTPGFDLKLTHCWGAEGAKRALAAHFITSSLLSIRFHSAKAEFRPKSVT